MSSYKTYFFSSVLLFFGASLISKTSANTPVQLLNNTIELFVFPPDSEKIFAVVENMPQFPGGDEALFRYLDKSVKHPDTAKGTGIRGRVFVQFLIETDGTITNVRVVRGIDDACNKEAKRVVEAMPKWKPGRNKGKTVKVRYNLPVKFEFKDSNPAQPSPPISNVKLVAPPADSTAAKEKERQEEEERRQREREEEEERQKEEEEKGESFVIVEKMPEFPGGKKALTSYLAKNIVYPAKAKEKKETGTVYVSFVVEKNGSVSNVGIIEGISKELDKEAIRVSKSLPDWLPGSQRGIPVRVRYTLPVKFTL